MEASASGAAELHTRGTRMDDSTGGEIIGNAEPSGEFKFPGKRRRVRKRVSNDE